MSFFRTALAVGLFVCVQAQGGLVGFYTFEGNARDVSGNGNHATFNGATLTASGFEGQAYDFTGTSTSHIVLPININASSKSLLTMGAWVHADTATGLRGILSQDNGGFDRALGIDNRGGCSGSWCFGAFTGSGVIAGPVASTSQWVFLAVRYNQGTGAVRLNVNTTQTSAVGTAGPGVTNLTVGRNPSFSEFFDGRIDNVFVYDEFLSDARIEEIRTGGAAAISGVPEPATFGLIGASLAGVFLRRRRR